MGKENLAVSGMPTFDDLLLDPMEQFDQRSELLSSILQYLAAPPVSAGTQAWTPNSGPQHAWLYAPSTTGSTAVA